MYYYFMQRNHYGTREDTEFNGLIITKIHHYVAKAVSHFKKKLVEFYNYNVTNEICMCISFVYFNSIATQDFC